MPVQRAVTSVLAAMLGTPVVVVFFRMPVARPESAVPLIWFALTTPVPLVVTVHPVPQVIVAEAFVPLVIVLNAAEPAVPPEVPQLNWWVVGL